VAGQYVLEPSTDRPDVPDTPAPVIPFTGPQQCRAGTGSGNVANGSLVCAARRAGVHDSSAVTADDRVQIIR
jgi:hypothetical protein